VAEDGAVVAGDGGVHVGPVHEVGGALELVGFAEAGVEGELGVPVLALGVGPAHDFNTQIPGADGVGGGGLGLQAVGGRGGEGGLEGGARGELPGGERGREGEVVHGPLGEVV